MSLHDDFEGGVAPASAHAFHHRPPACRCSRAAPDVAGQAATARCVAASRRARRRAAATVQEVVLGAMPTDWDDLGRNPCLLGELRASMCMRERVCGVVWSAGTRTMKTHENARRKKSRCYACCAARISPTVMLNGLISTCWNHNTSVQRTGASWRREI